VAAAKTKSRKELLKSPDEFITFSTRLVAAYRQHEKTVFYALAALLVLAAVVAGYRFYVQRSEAAAGAMLDKAIARYEELSRTQSKEQAFQQVAESFKEIIRTHGGRRNGDVARLIFADMCYEAGDTVQAIDLYTQSLERFAATPQIHAQILESLGYAYVRQKDYAGAVRYFDQALPESPPALQDDVLFLLGELNRLLDNADKSKEAFDRILREHADSDYAQIVREQIGG
jgi:tetratricopeptide (TPR) repeat protein